jgi:hypothetical protein
LSSRTITSGKSPLGAIRPIVAARISSAIMLRSRS